MKNQIRRFFSVLLCVVLVLTLFPADGGTGGGKGEAEQNIGNAVRGRSAVAFCIGNVKAGVVEQQQQESGSSKQKWCGYSEQEGNCADYGIGRREKVHL